MGGLKSSTRQPPPWNPGAVLLTFIRRYNHNYRELIGAEAKIVIPYGGYVREVTALLVPVTPLTVGTLEPR